VGCYLSHVRALELMKPGDVFAVFEEDAHFASNGASKLKQLHNFIERTALSYDVIMIGINRIPAPSGETTNMPVSEKIHVLTSPSLVCTVSLFPLLCIIVLNLA
jgi:hypothetical protein